MTAGRSRLLAGVSGIRGVVGAAMTPEVACRLGACFARKLPLGPVIVGRDTRPSGEVLLRAVAVGVAGVGRDVVDVGVCPTPTVQIATRETGACGGVVVTGSHNPEEWNGLKFVSADGTFLDSARTEELWSTFLGHETLGAGWDGMGRLRHRKGIGEIHLRTILACPLVSADEVKTRSLRVAIDCNNGAGSGLAPALLRRLGCRVVRVNCRGDGRFAHLPEPVPANLSQLCEVVRETRADVGMAVDPDADRLSLVDERGEALGEELSLPLAVLHVLERRTGPVVVNYSTSAVTEAVCSRFGVPMVRAPVGEVNVVTEMRRIGAVVGGEGNGGVILPEVQYARDSLVGMSLVVGLLADKREPLSSLRAQLPRMAMVKRAVPFTREHLPALLEKLPSLFPEATLLDRDGLRVEWVDGWVHVRMSRTEPVLRAIAECSDEEKALAVVDEVLSLAGRASAGHP
jgi:phosphomannomutase